MIRRENLLVDPLLSHVLSGEFQPATDPEQRTHTLGLLAHETVLEGKNIPGSGNNSVGFVHRPAWAEAVEVTASCSTSVLSDELVLSGLSLQARRSGTFSVKKTTAPAAITDYHFVIIEDGTQRITYDLTMGPELSRAKTFVARTVQDFFDTASNYRP